MSDEEKVCQVQILQRSYNCVNVITPAKLFFFVTDDWEDREFVPGKAFRPSLILASKARAYREEHRGALSISTLLKGYSTLA